MPHGDDLISIEFSELDLSNGLHVILSPDRSVSVVAVDVWYHVGSKNEEPFRTGLAHLFEHMMFQGSANIGKAEHMKYVERAGGVFNGSTTWDRTNYFETLPSSRLELALWLESDRMMSLDVSRKNFENQRKVVKEERRYRIDNRPYGTAWEKLFSLAYLRHPYRWPVAGRPEHLDAASVSDVRAFFGKYYVPNNAVLSIAGDFESEHTVRLIERYFGDIEPGDEIRMKSLADPPLSGRRADRVYDNVTLPAVFLAFRVPSMHSAESDALNLAAGILARGKSSRLYRRLVYEKKVAQSVEAYQIEMEDPGVFVIKVVASPGQNPEEIESEIRKELHGLAARPPHEKEVTKIKNQYASDQVRQLSRTLRRADAMAHFQTFFRNTGLVNTYLDRFLILSARDIRNVSEKYLDTENSVAVYYLPVEGSDAHASR